MHKTFYMCVCGGKGLNTILQGREYVKWPGALMNIAKAVRLYLPVITLANNYLNSEYPPIKILTNIHILIRFQDNSKNDYF